MLEKMKERKEVERDILLFEYFWKETEKTLGNKGFEKRTHRKNNENDDSSSTDIAGLVLVRGLDGCYRGRGENKKHL